MEEQNNIAQKDTAEGVKPKRSMQDIVGAELRRQQARKKSDTDDVSLQWYIVQAYSGQEKRAVEQLKEGIAKNGLDKFFGDIKIPQEDVTEVVRGEKQTVTKKFFPGYVLVEMHVNEDTWHLIKDTPKIVGFVGDSESPIPMEQGEVERLLTQMEEGTGAMAASDRYEVGDAVKVKEGPFVDFTGTVDEVKPDKGKLRVLISIFGRATPVELEFYQVEKQL